MSFGLETLGKWIDGRINGYFPVGSRISSPYHLKFDKFVGNNMYVKEQFQYALTGGNGEVAIHLPSGSSASYQFKQMNPGVFNRTTGSDSSTNEGEFSITGSVGDPGSCSE